MEKKFIKLNEHLIKIDDIENFYLLKPHRNAISKTLCIKTKTNRYELVFKSETETIDSYNDLVELLVDKTLEDNILYMNNSIEEYTKPKIIINPDKTASNVHCRAPLTSIDQSNCCILIKYNEDDNMVFTKH